MNRTYIIRRGKLRGRGPYLISTVPSADDDGLNACWECWAGAAAGWSDKAVATDVARRVGGRVVLRRGKSQARP